MSDRATITILMDQPCTRCRKKGAISESGVCLDCLTKDITEGRMPRRQRPADDAQPPLVPMTEEEIHKAGAGLAMLTGELQAMEIDHAELRKEQKTERDGLHSEILSLAETIRTAGR